MSRFKKISICLALLAAVTVAAVVFWRQSGEKETVAFRLDIPSVYSEPLTVAYGQLALSVRPLGASAVAKVESDNNITYASAYAQTDVIQTIGAYDIKESVMLNAPGHPAEFRYELGFEDFDYKVEENGDIVFYQRAVAGEAARGDEALRKIFVIKAPFMIDAAGVKSSVKDVTVKIEGNILSVVPSAVWLGAHQYPVNLDPTIEISVLNVFSHPDQGDDWIVDFRTIGTADLVIAANDIATVNDDVFVSLWCGDNQVEPSFVSLPVPGGASGEMFDAISIEDWQCDDISKIIHNTVKAGDHTLRFRFGDEIAYAYNHFLGDRKYAWSENAGWISASTTHESIAASSTGLTGYAWGENIGWIKMDHDGVPGAVNSSETDWGVTNDGQGNLGGYAWGENIGWINFYSSSSRVTIDSDSGKFAGYAWSPNIGWINFGHNQLDYIMEDFGAPLAITKAAMIVSADVFTAAGIGYRHGYDITTRGFKYGTSTADTWTVSEAGAFLSGEFKLEIPNLTAGTTYYFRAFATNAAGTTYGSYVQVTTGASKKGTPVIFNKNVILNRRVIVK